MIDDIPFLRVLAHTLYCIVVRESVELQLPEALNGVLWRFAWHMHMSDFLQHACRYEHLNGQVAQALDFMHANNHALLERYDVLNASHRSFGSFGVVQMATVSRMAVRTPCSSRAPDLYFNCTCNVTRTKACTVQLCSPFTRDWLSVLP
jgi:hypothetical protein